MAPPALPGFNATMTLSEAQASRRPIDGVGVAPTGSGLPPITQMTFSTCRAHYPGGSVWYACRFSNGAFPRQGFPKPLWPSRNERPVGIHKFPFEACSSFTRVTACGVARPPKRGLCHEASYPDNYSSRTLVSYPGISTTPGVGLSPTGNLRRWGARSFCVIRVRRTGLSADWPEARRRTGLVREDCIA